MSKHPITPAIRVLRGHKVAFTPHLYHYEEKGGTAVSARELAVPEQQIIKTLIFEDERKQPLVVLMDGSHQVSTKTLARLIKVKSITPCDPASAQKHSGYQLGGTSPFGTKKTMPVYMQSGIADLETLYINGGKRGFLVAISGTDLVRVLTPTTLDIAI